MQIEAVGVDLTEIARFRPHSTRTTTKLVSDVFTEREQAYCFAHKDPAPHLAGMFAAKEAALKAWGTPIHVRQIEVRHTPAGKPELWVKGKRVRSLLVSITHTTHTACAVALKQC